MINFEKSYDVMLIKLFVFQGKVSSWISERDGVGLMRCATRDTELAFNVCECLDVHKTGKRIEVGDECEFTAAQAEADLQPGQGGSGMVAIRIKHLAQGTVEFDQVIHRDVIGKVRVILIQSVAIVGYLWMPMGKKELELIVALQACALSLFFNVIQSM